jgi:hypothetical protein
MTDGERADAFLSLSVALTGFSRHELTATGSTDLYLHWLCGEFPTVFTEMLERWREIERNHPSGEPRERALHRHLLAERRLGPFARNLALLWYTATWQALPLAWAGAHHQPKVAARAFASAYPESLAWKAAGTHPVGANPTGFGSWALPPPPLRNGGGA